MLTEGILKYIVIRFPTVLCIGNENDTKRLPIYELKQQYHLVDFILHKMIPNHECSHQKIEEFQNNLLEYYKRENFT